MISLKMELKPNQTKTGKRQMLFCRKWPKKEKYLNNDIQSKHNARLPHWIHSMKLEKTDILQKLLWKTKSKKDSNFEQSPTPLENQMAK